MYTILYSRYELFDAEVKKMSLLKGFMRCLKRRDGKCWGILSFGMSYVLEDQISHRGWQMWTGESLVLNSRNLMNTANLKAFANNPRRREASHRGINAGPPGTASRLGKRKFLGNLDRQTLQTTSRFEEGIKLRPERKFIYLKITSGTEMFSINLPVSF